MNIVEENETYIIHVVQQNTGLDERFAYTKNVEKDGQIHSVK